MWNKPTKDQLDLVPRLYETESISLSEKLIYLHFFIFGSELYIAEYDGKDLFWGFVILNQDYINAEWGYISYKEICGVQVNGIEVDCEINWVPRRACEIDKIKRCFNSGCFEMSENKNAG